MSPAELSFTVIWSHYAFRALFRHDRDTAWATFKEIWDMAIDEAASVAGSESSGVSKFVLELRA